LRPGPDASGTLAASVELPIDELLSLARYLTQRRSLGDLLVVIVERCSVMLGARRASIRVLDPQRRALVATCRSGEPLHEDPRPFAMGEGLLGWVAAHEEVIRLADAERDPRFASREDVKERVGSFLGVPLVAGSGCLGVLSFASPELDHFDERDESVALLIAAMVAPHLEVARLARLSNLDPLTGLLNRRGLDALAGERVTDPSFTAVMVDIDHFKRVNDAYGHDVGDRALRLVADALSHSVRRGDSVARFGGEEFVLLLDGADTDVALRIAERARERLAHSYLDVGRNQIAMTASFGVALARPGESVEAAVKRADAAMYQAKHAGRDRVVLSE